MSSWVGEEDRCRWEAIECDTIIGPGDLNPSVELKQLDCLDLSWNNHTSVPDFFGSVRSSRYHIFPSSGVAEWILIALETSQTCLSMNYLYMTDLQWLYGISSLKYIDSRSSMIELSS
ncbi:hypothetical protein NC652_009034 [Populus alba x Populus x berolinensis]|nr:hypothetical protein NC652_009034 [Populus alba x Populus x berolinensis]